MDPASERLMESILADCLALPESQIPSSILRACEEHPAVAVRLRRRYEDLLRMGILERPEDEERPEESQAGGST